MSKLNKILVVKDDDDINNMLCALLETDISYTDDDTVLVGEIVYQSAFHGVFKKVRDLGITLISVNRIKR